MMAWAASSRLRRALVSLAVLAALYGIASEMGNRVLPRRIWMGAHYVENVELLPPYASLAEEAVFLIRSGILPASLLASGARVLGGVLLGSMVGIPLGLALGWAPPLRYLAEPWLAFFRFTPAFVLLPLFVLWFGLGEASKILLIASGVAIVTLEGALDGVRRTPRLYLDAASALGAGAGLVLRRLMIPAAVPSILASLRIAVALAWVTMVVAELIRPTMPSLGYLLALSGAYPRTPTMGIGIVTIGALVLASDALTLGAYRRGTRWMRRQDGH